MSSPGPTPPRSDSPSTTAVPSTWVCGVAHTQVIGIIMISVTSLTFLLPDSINSRKPTLREFAQTQHEQLEAESIELVTLKTLEHSNENEEKGDTRSNAPDAQIVPSAPKVEVKEEVKAVEAVVDMEKVEASKPAVASDATPAILTTASTTAPTAAPANNELETISP